MYLQHLIFEKRKARQFKLISIIGTVLLVALVAILSLPTFQNTLFSASFIEFIRFTNQPISLSSFFAFILVFIVALVINIPLALYLGFRANRYSYIQQSYLKGIFICLAMLPSLFWFYLYYQILPFYATLPPIANALLLFVVMTLTYLPILLYFGYSAILKIPKHISEAAYSLGATPFEVVYGILLPYILNYMILGLITALIKVLFEYILLRVFLGFISNTNAILLTLVLLIIITIISIIVFQNLELKWKVKEYGQDR